MHAVCECKYGNTGMRLYAYTHKHTRACMRACMHALTIALPALLKLGTGPVTGPASQRGAGAASCPTAPAACWWRQTPRGGRPQRPQPAPEATALLSMGCTCAAGSSAAPLVSSAQTWWVVGAPAVPRAAAREALLGVAVWHAEVHVLALLLTTEAGNLRFM